MTQAQEALDALERASEGGSNDAEISAGRTCADLLGAFMYYEDHRPNVPAPGYTHDRVSRAMNRAVTILRSQVLGYENSRTIAAQSLMDLLVNAGMTLLDDPDLSLSEIIESNYQLDDATCRECGSPVFIDNGVSHHYTGSTFDRIDHDQDGDHVAIPEPASATDMVLGWLEDIN